MESGFDPQAGSEVPGGDFGSGDLGEPNSDEKLWAMLSHLSIFVFSIFGPLIIYLVKKEESEYIRQQSLEALNFQIAVLVIGLISIVTCIGPLVVAIGGMIYGILATVDVNKGVNYRYPYTIRFIN